MPMERTNRREMSVKLLLDLLLVAVILTLYSKNVISLMYHEAAGLILGGLFLVHLVFNRKWIIRVGVKAFSSRSTGKTRIMAVVDLLLLLAWLGVIISGILVSKKIFSFNVRSATPWHFFFAAAALILSGIHLGLHKQYLDAAIRRIPLLGALKKPLTTVLMVIVLAFGVYSFGTSGFTRWISAPFVSTASAGHGSGAAGGSGYGAGEAAGAGGAAGAAADAGEAAGAEESAGDATGAGEAAAPGDAAGAERPDSISSATKSAAGSTEAPANAGSGSSSGHGMQQNFSISRLAGLVASIFSMLYVVVMAVSGLETLARRRKAG
jgi:hypothetical protein